eukprot:TRINITY_DN25701_c0_g1_i1.p1 TRINITY_DN25701_c0_g1~~TRINITY_DN25701_c0_g1_i1.p1  ORF type:complete len:207 (+),score=27.61 TRINITY_DN25701_c0_g1_i1:31-621(+)
MSSAQLLAARKKLRKSNRNPTALEDEVAKAIFDLEVNNKNLKTPLTNLYINTVKEVEVHGKKALVIFFPLRFIRKFHKIQRQLVVELEKKFGGATVVMIAQRKIARKPKSNLRSIQRSRTMQAVHDAILDDICYPSDIVGKRIRYHPDGSKVIRVYLDGTEKDRTENRVDIFQSIYKKLTGKEVKFGYMKPFQQIV